MNKHKLQDALRRAGRTFAQAAGAYLVFNPGQPAKAAAVGAVGAGLAGVWRLWFDPAEPPPATGGWLPKPPPAINVHVAGTDPAKVADEVAKQVRQANKQAAVPPAT